jgi:hypothetical protein
MVNLVPVLQNVGLGLFVVLVIAAILALLYRSNRLFFWCFAGALGGHLLVAGVLYGISHMGKPIDEERRIRIAAFMPAPKKVEPPKPKPLPETLDLPWGQLTGRHDVRTPPKGTNKAGKQAGGNNSSAPAAPGRPMVDGISDDGSVPVDEKDAGLLRGTFSDVIDASEVASTISSGGSGSGDGAGTPDGEGSGPIPFGFPNGKRNGRVYFVRLKHGSGAWNAHADGTRKLLNFCNAYFPCESDSWPMTANEMRTRYMSKNVQPTFIYIYCDETFSLSTSEVTVLQSYMNKGGFLFVDSRPDPFIRDLVASEISKVLPGMHMTPIPRSNNINSFLFRLSSPGIGANIITNSNYGITSGGRLAVFYTMGNFSQFFASFTPDTDEYVKAQYQMGANVILYAIQKGNNAGISQMAGARAEVNTQTIDKLFNIGGGGGGARPQADPDKPPESIKIKKTNPTPTEGGGEGGGEGTTTNTAPTEDEPDDIKMSDD